MSYATKRGVGPRKVNANVAEIRFGVDMKVDEALLKGAKMLGVSSPYAAAKIMVLACCRAIARLDLTEEQRSLVELAARITSSRLEAQQAVSAKDANLVAAPIVEAARRFPSLAPLINPDYDEGEAVLCLIALSQGGRADEPNHGARVHAARFVLATVGCYGPGFPLRMESALAHWDTAHIVAACLVLLDRPTVGDTSKG